MPYLYKIIGIVRTTPAFDTSIRVFFVLVVKCGWKPMLYHVGMCHHEFGLAQMTDALHEVRRIIIVDRSILNMNQLGFAYAEGVSEAILFPASESDTDRRTIFPNECLQVFAQMFALEGGQLTKPVNKAAQKTSPRRLTITLRYTDWWYWESNAPLRIEDSWSEDFVAPASVEEIVLELETRNGKKPELDALISRQISKWEFHTAAEVDLVHVGKPMEEFWVGSSKPGGLDYNHHTKIINRSNIMGKDEMLYYTVKMRWRKAA
jgi:hypothetical protein